MPVVPPFAFDRNLMPVVFDACGPPFAFDRNLMPVVPP